MTQQEGPPQPDPNAGLRARLERLSPEQRTVVAQKIAALRTQIQTASPETLAQVRTRLAAPAEVRDSTQPQPPLPKAPPADAEALRRPTVDLATGRPLRTPASGAKATGAEGPVGAAAPEVVTQQGIQEIPRERIQIGHRPFAAGKSAEVYLARVEGIEKSPVIYKQPKMFDYAPQDPFSTRVREIVSRVTDKELAENVAEIRKHARIIKHLMSRGVERVVQLIGVAPNMEQTETPYMVQEYVVDLFNARNFDLYPSLHPANLADSAKREGVLRRAKWGWEVLQTVAELHEADVALVDAKADDFPLVEVTRPDGTTRLLVKAIDFGNAKYPEGEKYDKVSALEKRRDCEFIFALFTENGLSIPIKPDTDTQSRMNTDVSIQIFRNQWDSTLFSVWEKFVQARSRNETSPYANGRELAEALRPYFQKLGVAEAAPPQPEITTEAPPAAFDATPTAQEATKPAAAALVPEQKPAGGLTLTFRNVPTFTKALGLQRALQTLDGVHEARAVGFEKGVLSITLDYDPAKVQSINEAIRELLNEKRKYESWDVQASRVEEEQT